jgi:hypothetical protein
MKRKRKPFNASKAVENSDKAPANGAHMTLSQFRINEVVYWMINHDRLVLRHRLEEFDAIVCSDENETAKLFDFDEIVKEGIEIGIPIKRNGVEIVFYRALTPQILRKKEISELSDLHNFGFYHHQLLSGVLHSIDEFFLHFLQRIEQFKFAKIAVTNKASEAGRALIEDIVDFIEQAGIKTQEQIIPDLYTYHRDTSFMSFNMKFMYESMEGQRDGKKYTYMFSRNSSGNFATVLLELLNKKLHNQKLIESFDITNEQNLLKYNLPGDTKERLKWLEDFYGLNTLNRVHRLGYKNSELMFLFRILQDEKLILNNIPKEQLILAISILTGISINTLYNKYSIDNPADFLKMADTHSKESVQTTKNKIANAVIGGFSKAAKRNL